jgi:serine/threonine-protein kinase
VATSSSPGAPRSQDTSPNVTVIEFVETETRRTTLVAIGILLVFVLATATYFGLKRSLKEISGADLVTRLNAELRTLDVWIAQANNQAERWARDPRVREAVSVLVARPQVSGSQPASSCQDPATARLVEILQPAISERGFVSFDIFDRSGLVIASSVSSYCGQRVSARSFLSPLERAFGGRASFLPPLMETDRLPALAKPRFIEPLVWFSAAVTDGQGQVVAVLAFAERASAGFAALLRATNAGETDEIYLFNERGVLLSESRHADKLAERGLLKDRASTRTMLQVEIRDPGDAPADAAAEGVRRGAQPLTRLAALAISSRQAAEGGGQSGVLLEPYRNYFGAQVVGAWRWLPAYDVAAALEIDVAEAFAPLKFFDRAFAVVFGIASAAAIGLLIAWLTNVRMRRGLGGIRRLGHYTLIREIGEGGMASVYLGRHALLKRPIAIKILKRALANEEMIARFEREVQLASQLAHPNTIEIFDYGRTRAGDFYYVMEYLDGITLAALSARDGAIGAARTIYVLRQVCAALKEAHARAIVHRDIKPENIMVCVRGGEYDVVKILDFGLVKSMGDAVTRDITHSVKVLGTPAYMAPERFIEAGAADERSDIYGVGAVGYLMLCGQRIYHDASGDELQARIMHGTLARPSSLHGVAIPDALEHLIMRCLAKKPEDRIASANELMVLLEQLALGHRWSQADAARWWQDFRAAPSAEPTKE